MTTRGDSFDQLLLDSIDEGLSVLGNEPQQAVYHFLLTICSLRREEIPEHVAEFDAGLKKALGGAAKVIERVILKKLFEKTSSPFREAPETDFKDYVADAKRRFEILSHRHEETPEGVRSKKGQVSG